MNRRDLQSLARTRLAEARALLDAGHPDGAWYLAGYAVECALKACIARRTQRHDFPDKKSVDASYTHNLRDLIKVANLELARSEEAKGNSGFRNNWDVVQQWSEQSRYLRHDSARAQLLVEAIGRSEKWSNGVVKTALLATDLAVGPRIVSALDRAALPVSVALWLYSPDHEDWRFVLASRRLDAAGPSEYGLVHDALESAGISQEQTPVLMILRMSDPFIRALRRIFSKTKCVEGMRLGGQMIGNWFVEDALVYRVR